MSKLVSLAELDAVIAAKKAELTDLETDRAALANYVAHSTTQLMGGGRIGAPPALSAAGASALNARRAGSFLKSMFAGALATALLTSSVAFVYGQAKNAYDRYCNRVDVAEAVPAHQGDEEILEVRRWFVDGPQTAERRRLRDAMIASVEADRAEERARRDAESDKQSRANVDAFIRSIDAAKAEADAVKARVRAEGDAIRKSIRRDDGHYRPLGAEGVRALGGR